MNNNLWTAYAVKFHYTVLHEGMVKEIVLFCMGYE